MRTLTIMTVGFLMCAGCGDDNPMNDRDKAVTFARAIGGTGADGAYSVAVTDDGGYIVAGWTTSFYRAGVYLIRLDTSGDTLWTKSNSSGGAIGGNSLDHTNDGGFIITGRNYLEDGDSIQVLLMKTDSAGVALWTRAYGGLGEDIGNEIRTADDGGFFIAGTTNSFGAGGDDVYLLRTNSAGDTIWTRTFGGPDDEIGESVALTDDGGCIVVGRSGSLVSNHWDFYAIRVEADGDTAWTRTYGGTSTEWAYSIAATIDGNYVIGGRTASYGAGSNDLYLVKIDADGDTLWTRTYGGTSTDRGLAVAATPDGGCLIAGSTNATPSGHYDMYVVKTDADGALIWVGTAGGSESENAFAVAATADGGCILAGSTLSTGSIYGDVYVVKLNSSGNL